MSTIAVAETPVSIDLETLSGETQKSVLNALKEQAKKELPLTVSLKDITPEKINTWSVAIANGIKETSQVLNVEVNEFIKTPVGKGTAFIIFWKVAGKDLWEGTGRTILFICFTFCINIFLYSVAIWFLIPKKTKIHVELSGHSESQKSDFCTKAGLKNKDALKDAKSVTYDGKIMPYNWGSSIDTAIIIVLYWMVALIINLVCFANIV
jgi:hypothetical protein